MNPGSAPQPPKNLALYATLQALTLVVCWLIFVSLGTYSLMNFDLGDLGGWALLVVAFIAVYGLRPNLEKAIDSAWLSDIKSPQALTERIAQLRPIKRRIDIFFSVGLLIIIALGLLIWSILLATGTVSFTA